MNNEHVYYLNGKQVRYKAEYVKAFCETVHFDPNTGQIIHTLNAVTNID